MVLFLTLFGTARLRRGWRFVVIGASVAFAYFSQRWELVFFYAGMVLAEMDVARSAHGGSGAAAAASCLVSASTSRSSSPAHLSTRRCTPRRAMWAVVSIVGLFLMSQPDERGADTPGWVFLTSLIPEWWTDEHRYWQSAGSVLFVLAVGRSRGWQRFFTSPVPQYFGRISYTFYLMHGPVMHTAGYSIEKWAWGADRHRGEGVRVRLRAGGNLCGAHRHLGVRRILAGCRCPRRELCEVAGGEMFDL
ncbi:hypothetical protein VTG60DRAFT_1044 [Thermothelomyces hinnuleus]